MRHSVIALLIVVSLAVAACSRANLDYRAPSASPPASTLAIVDAPLPDGFAGSAYTATITAAGTAGASLRWSFSTGALPPGLSLAPADGATVTISGTPTTAGKWSLTVEADDDEGASATRTFDITIWSLRIDGELPEAIEGQPYDATFTLVGGHGRGLAWSIGGAAPPGLVLVSNGRTAHLQGTPRAGQFAFRLVAVDADGGRVERTLSLLARSSLAIDADALPDAVAGIAFAASMRVSGGAGSGYHWQATGALPPGLALSEIGANAVALQGTPQAAGVFAFSIDVSDATGGAATRSVRLTVSPALQIVTDHVPDGAVQATYQATIAATGGSGSAYQWSVVAGALPTGLGLTGNGGTATLAGSPTVTGSFAFTIAAALPTGERATRAFQVMIGANPPRIVTSSLPSGQWGMPYDATVAGQSAVGGAVAWRVGDGALPPGVALAPSALPSVALAGTPLQCGQFTFTISMSDAGGTASAPLSITVGAVSELEVLGRVFRPARVGRPYSAHLAARGAAAVQWDVVDGVLPTGLALTSGGAVEGTPTQAGWFPFAARATDAAGHTAQARFALLVAAPRWWIAMAHTATFTGSWSVTARDVSGATPGPATDLLADVAAGGGSNGVYDLTFSSNPDWLTFTVGNLDRTTLYLADLRAQPTTKMLAFQSLRGDRSAPATWSPDGTRLDYAEEPVSGSFNFAHRVVDTTSAMLTTTSVTAAPCGYERAWSPDAARLAVASADGATIYVFDGSATRAVALSAPITASRLVGWSPDSSALIFVGTDASAQSRLFALAVDADMAFPLSPNGVSVDSYSMARSSDGGSLAFSNAADDTVYLLDLRSRQIGFAVPVASGNAPRWSPDSQRLLFSTGSSAGSAIVDRDHVEEILTLADGALGSRTRATSWSLDGRWIALPTDTGLFALPPDGSAATQLLAPPGQSAPYDWLSSDSSLLVFEQGGLSALDAASPLSAPLKLDPNVSDVSSSFAIAHDRKAVFYYYFGSPAQGTHSRLWLVDFATGAPTAPIELLDFGDGVVHYSVSDPAFGGSD